MQALRGAVGSRPSLLELLQEAATLQACPACCLRLAGIRDAAAYTCASLPATAAGVVAALQPAAGSSAAAAATADGDEAAAAPPDSKRQRTEEPQAAGAAAGAVAPASGVCPLCLGVLQSAPSGSGAPWSPACTLQLVTTASTLNDPSRRVAWGEAAPAAAADALAAADAAAAVNGAAEAEAGAGPDPAACAPIVERRVAAAPSLAAAARSMAGEYELEGGFGLDVTLPASLAVRHQALAWRVRERLGGAAAQELSQAVDLKEAVKLCYGASLAASLSRPLDPQAALRIGLSFSHPEAAAECGWLAASGGGGGGGGRQHGGCGRRRDRRSQQQQQQQPGDEVTALTEAVVQRLAALPQATFAAQCPGGAASLATPAAAAVVAVQAQRRPLLIGGRYLKLRRGIPQSPWFIDGRRKGEGSVQEAIEGAVLPALQADSYTLVTAGREDIDVRMLGSGRPFILEVHNARHRVPPPDALRRLQAAVAEVSGGGVAADCLFAATPGQLAQMKEGEQEKQKAYVAVCWLPRPLTDADVALLEGTQDLEVQQETPIRVLHRRANLCRPRTLHELNAARLPGRPPGYFALRLRAQAGTYIKEFVHGDLGRSRPCLGDLLGCPAQIVSLDVAGIHMQFGPSTGDTTATQAAPPGS